MLSSDARNEGEISAKWKDPAFVIGFKQQQQGLFRQWDSSRSTDTFDVNDYAFGPGDWSDVTDWQEHQWDELRSARAAGIDLRFHGGTKPGRGAQFIFPDEGISGWLEIASREGAPSDQVQKAAAMAGRGLVSKARRQAYCNIVGARYDCASFEPGRSGGHKFFRRFACKNRYCLCCGPLTFRTLFCKYAGLKDVVAKLVPCWPPRRGCRLDRVVAKLDFTSRNLGRMPTRDEVRLFNQAIRRFFRLAERHFGFSRDQYGVLFCDEFGCGNTNLHAHAMYAGPWLPNRKGYRNLLSGLWRTACQGTPFAGSFIISVKSAKSFAEGLGHALKYTGKILSRNPERLAELEVAFHGVRRVHTLGAFYNVALVKDSGGVADDFACPDCGAALVRSGSLSPIRFLEGQGCRDLDSFRREEGRAKVFAARASPCSS